MRHATVMLLILTGPLALGSASGNGPDEASLADLSLEELGAIEVTSVSRQSERLADAPASVYVITNEDIRRSGATSLGEALRLAPNLQVARVDSVQYAVSARGFNNAIGNKLLVMIDGRTIYTPLFSGVFWDQQDVLLADVERIEVISGPGAALWGANAVNGVINIITRPAGETQGALVSLGGGSMERNASVRYGGAAGAGGHFRVYAKAVSVDRTKRESGEPALDEWQRAQVGFRADWAGGDDRLTVQGDAYSGHSEDRGTISDIFFGRIDVSGMNLLGRWRRQLGAGSELRVRGYFDRAERDDRLFFRPKAEIYDLEVQHAVARGLHDVLWGGGYRRATDEVGSGFFATFIPVSRTLHWTNLFVQDRIRLTRKVEVTLGAKLERNDFTGTELLPTARLAWKPSANRLVWAAASRAVRAPSRFDRDVYFPSAPPYVVVGGPNFESEVADVLELGYRAQPSNSLSYSVTAYYHDWHKLRSGTAIPVELENRIAGGVHGAEAWATWRALPQWRLSAGFSTLDKDLRLEPGSTDPVGVDNATLANDADYQWVLRSALDLRAGLELDMSVRHVAALPNPAVPDYTALDARLGWQPRPHLDFAVTVRNALDSKHPEFGQAPTRSELPRTVFLEARMHLSP